MCFAYLLHAICFGNTYQIAYNNLWACLDSKVQRSQLGSILNSGIDISLDTDQEQNTFNIRVLNCQVKKIPALVIHLRQQVGTKILVCSLMQQCLLSSCKLHWPLERSWCNPSLSSRKLPPNNNTKCTAPRQKADPSYILVHMTTCAWLYPWGQGKGVIALI